MVQCPLHRKWYGFYIEVYVRYQQPSEAIQKITIAHCSYTLLTHNNSPWLLSNNSSTNTRNHRLPSWSNCCHHTQHSMVAMCVMHRKLSWVMRMIHCSCQKQCVRRQFAKCRSSEFTLPYLEVQTDYLTLCVQVFFLCKRVQLYVGILLMSIVVQIPPNGSKSI
jgi:hypothetical protein